MRMDLPRCNFKNCHWCQDSNCYKKTRDYCEYHWQSTEIERLKNLVGSECERCACELLDERDKAIEEAERYKKYYFHHEYDQWEAEIKADTVRKMQEKIRAKSEYGTINMSSWQLEQIAKEVLEENK